MSFLSAFIRKAFPRHLFKHHDNRAQEITLNRYDLFDGKCSHYSPALRAQCHKEHAQIWLR